jgi:hypothetical protein
MPDPTPKKKLPDDVRSLVRAYTHMGVKVLAASLRTARPSRSVRRCRFADRGVASQNWMQQCKAKSASLSARCEDVDDEEGA